MGLTAKFSRRKVGWRPAPLACGSWAGAPFDVAHTLMKRLHTGASNEKAGTCTAPAPIDVQSVAKCLAPVFRLNTRPR